MAKKSSIPKGFLAYRDWHDRYKTAMAALGASLGFTPAEVAQVGTDNGALHTKGDAQANAQVVAEQTTKDRDAAWAEIDTRTRKFAGRAKLSTAYTDAIGVQLGIEGVEDSFNPATAKPKLTGTAQPDGVVQLAFSKENADGVNMYCQRDAETDFTFLARDTSSPYVDNRPLIMPGKPEVRRYRCRYILHDVEIGIPSDEIVVTAQPY